MKKIFLAWFVFCSLASASFVSGGGGGNTLGLSCSDGQIPEWSGLGFTACLTASGSGTVTSVGLKTDTSTASIFANTTNNLTGSPVTAAGNITLTLSNQTTNKVLAAPNGSTGAPTFRVLAGADLPNPSASTLGGTQSVAAVTSNWLDSISTSGVPHASQPAFTDISGSVAATQLPNPSSSTLGGIRSLAAVSHNWINTISTSGVPSATQPASTDLSDASSLAGSGANSNITSMTGVTTSISSPTFIDHLQITTPATPAASHDRLYFKSDDHLYLKTSGGVETQVDGGGGGSGVTTVGAFSGSSQANGASISSTTITFGPADGTNPGMISESAQTMGAGAKTFAGDILTSADGSNNIGSDTTRFSSVHALNVMGLGNTGFVGGDATIFFKRSGNGGFPTLTWYTGSGSSYNLYVTGATWMFNVGGTDAAGIDANGFYTNAGAAHIGKSTTTNGTFMTAGVEAIPVGQTISSNAGTTISNGTSLVKLAIGAAAQTQTLTMPAAMDAGGRLVIFTNAATGYTSLTINANSGQTMDTTFSAQVMAASTSHEWVFQSTVWYQLR